MRSTHLFATLALLLLAAPAVAENWPHWRGPDFDSTSGETGLPVIWSSGEDGARNVRWRYDLPGPAASSPIAGGERIFATSTWPWLWWSPSPGLPPQRRWAWVPLARSASMIWRKKLLGLTGSLEMGEASAELIAAL